MKVKSLFFFPFPCCDGWFQLKVPSFPLKKISTVILINKCLDLAVATLMLEGEKLMLGCFSFFVCIFGLFAVVLECFVVFFFPYCFFFLSACFFFFAKGWEGAKLGQFCHTWSKKRDLDILSSYFLHYARKKWSTHRGQCQDNNRMAYESAKCLEKSKRQYTSSYWPPVLASFSVLVRGAVWKQNIFEAEINSQTSKYMDKACPRAFSFLLSFFTLTQRSCSTTCKMWPLPWQDIRGCITVSIAVLYSFAVKIYIYIQFHCTYDWQNTKAQAGIELSS